MAMEQPMEPILREELMDQDLPSLSNNRLTFRSNLRQAVKTNCVRCFWSLSNAVDMLAVFSGLGFACLFCLLRFRFAYNRLLWEYVVKPVFHSECDQPLRSMLVVWFSVVGAKVILAMASNIARKRGHPRLSTLLRCLALPLTTIPLLVWPLCVVVMVQRADNCGTGLKVVIWITLALYLSLVVLISCIFLKPTVLFLLYRHKLLVDPDTAVTQDYQRIEYDVDTFQDGLPNGHPASCPICYDNFDSGQDIVCTPCPTRSHTFHRACLAGWLRMSHTCPLCRHDIPAAGTGGGDVGFIRQVELSMNEMLRSSHLEHLATD